MVTVSAAQVVAAVAWCSVLAAPWAAWLTGEPLRSPYVVAVIATSALVGSLAGMHHQGQVTMRRSDATAARRETGDETGGRGC